MPGTMLSFVLSIWDTLAEKTLSFLTRKSTGPDLEFSLRKLDLAMSELKGMVKNAGPQPETWRCRRPLSVMKPGNVDAPGTGDH